MKILPVIMCGGTGTRVWPESRQSLPKQFIPLIGSFSTFQSIIRTVGDREMFDEPIVITNSAYGFQVAEQLAEISATARIILEPCARDSGPAVATAAVLAEQYGADKIVAVLAADHIFQRPAFFAQLCLQAALTAQEGYIVTFGIRPDHAATGYGYIRTGEALNVTGDVRRIDAFIEKPDSATAQGFVDDGYLWNSGNFVFPATVMLREMHEYEPAMAEAARISVARMKPDLNFFRLDEESFGKAPRKSIDYAVMERTDRAAVIEADVGWSDVGLWETIWRLSGKDAEGNCLQGQAVAVNSRNVLVRSPERLTAVVGVENLIVITTSDAVLVVDSHQTDRVKELVQILKTQNFQQATDHERSYRPWGYYRSVDRGSRYQVKRIVVRPGGRLSLQMHHHRSEHWIVVCGTAEVTRDNEIVLIHENESIYIPIGARHRLANPGKIDLELIEVQTGTYLGEDDIIRLEDVYNRH